MGKGKFSSDEAESLYALAVDGNAWTGSDDFGISATMVILDADEAAEFGAPEGIFIVSETADGFVEVEAFDDEGDARDALASIEADYEEFMADNAPETAPGYAEA